MSPLNTKKLAGAVLGLTSLVSGAVAEATVLTFDGDFITGDSTVYDFSYDYGNRVTALEQNGFKYGLGAGFTPNITVEYINDPSDTPFTIWDSGYGDLLNVMGSCCAGFGEVWLVPDAGYSVVLHGFDVAPWNGDRGGNQVRVLDADDNVLFDSGLFTAIHANGHYHFPGEPIVSFSALRIINTTSNGALGFGYLGLDNVSFSQTVVPVPAALPLFLSAVAGVGLMRRTRRSPRAS